MHKTPVGNCAILFVALILSGCDVSIDWTRGVEGSGNIVSESRTLPEFDRIEIDGNVDADIRPGNRSFTITGDDNLLPLARTRVRGRVLVIDTERKVKPTDGIRAVITTPILNGVTAKGSSDIYFTGVRASAFALQVSGSGEVLGRGDFGDLTADVSGSGEITLEGTASEVGAAVSGSGEVDLSQVEARSANVDVSGSGEVVVQVSDRLDVTITGSGEVGFIGDPEVTSRITGSGEIHRM